MDVKDFLSPDSSTVGASASDLDPAFEHDLDLYFLGPKSEKRAFLFEALHLVLNDHVFWRRNYWPKDPTGHRLQQGRMALTPATSGRFSLRSSFLWFQT